MKKKPICLVQTTALRLLFVMLFASTVSWAQTNPTPQSIPYSQDFSTLAAPAYPAGWMGWTVASQVPSSAGRTNLPTADRIISVGDATNTASGIYDFSGKIGMLSVGTDVAMGVAVNLTGASNVGVTFDAMTIRNTYDGINNTNVEGLVLQYRYTTATWTNASSSGTTVTLGTGTTTGLVAGSTVVVSAGTGAFATSTTISSILNATQFTVSATPTTALAGATVSIGFKALAYSVSEYTNGTTAQLTGNAGQNIKVALNAKLPLECDNQPNVQIRWIFRNITTGLGSRPSMAIDNLFIGPSTNTISGSTFSQSESFNVTYVANGTFINGFIAQLSDATGSFAGTPVTIGNTSSTGSGTITATIPAGATAGGTGFRVRVVGITGGGTQFPASDNGTNITINPLTNPTPQSLPYFQDFSSLAAGTETVFPAGWIGRSVNTSNPPSSSGRTSGALSDLSLTAGGTGASTNNGVYNYSGKIGFLSTATRDNAITLAVNTTGFSSVGVSFDITTIRNLFDGSTNDIVQGMVLQYRVGTTGTFTALGYSLSEYTNGNTQITSGTAGVNPRTYLNALLPAACNNQPVVHLRWIYRTVSNTTTSNRPAMAIDNVYVGPSTGTISPSTYSPGEPVSVPFVANGVTGNFRVELSDASGSFAAPVVISIASSATSPISATIPCGTANGTGYRIRVVSTTNNLPASDNGSNLTVKAGSNPAVQSMPYNQDFASFTGSSNTYPAGWIGWQIATSGPSSTGRTGAPASDRTISGGDASTSSSGIYDYNGKIGFLSTNGADLSVGFAVNTTGNSNVAVSFDAMTIRNPFDGSTNATTQGLVLQYRVGTCGVFTNVNYLPVAYTTNNVTQTTGTTGQNIVTGLYAILPTACDNQPVVQIRWVYRTVGTAVGGRPSMAIDNVRVGCIPPSALGYSTSTAVYCANTSIANNNPSFTGDAATSYSVSPVLPAGLVLDPATGVISGTPTVATAAADYTVTVNNLCGFTTTVLNIAVNAANAITSVTADASPICADATTTLTANGVAGTNAVVTWYTGANGSGTNLGTGTSISAGPGTYYARVTGDCGAAAEASVTVNAKTNVSITSATAGAASICSNATTTLTANGVAGDGAIVTWYTGANGSGTNLGTGTSISAGPGTYYARVTGDCGAPAEASVTITTGANTFTGTGSWTDAARWSCGVVPSSGDAVVIGAGANATLNTDFTVAGSLSMTATSALTVNPLRTLTISGTANFNGQSVTFKSDNSGTGSLGQVTGTLSGATNVTVERYIPNNGFRAWRLLSVPTFGTQTIKQAWQEGNAALQNTTPGYGTQITGVAGNLAAAQSAGFDNVTSQGSLQRYNGTAWVGVSSTLNPISNEKAYFMFVRGDRTQGIVGATTQTTATTLRTRGSIYTGNQTTNVGINAFQVVANPFVSAIDFTGLTRTGGVKNTFYIWDSKKQSGTSLGAYQTFSATNGFACLLDGGSYVLGDPNTTIQSGQAFFVEGGATAGSVVIPESAKVAGSGTFGFRPATSALAMVKIDTRLYAVNGNSSNVADANAVVFDDVYAAGVDGDDALKLANPGENLAVVRNNQTLAVEGRPTVVAEDVIDYKIWNLREQQYRLEFAPQSMAGLVAELEDKYLNSRTRIDLTTTSTVNFAVTAEAGSKAADRFRLIFKPAAPLPVSFLSVSANRTAAWVQANWKVAAERNIRQYEVERSSDGRNFSKAGTVTATGNNTDQSYGFMDATAPAGTLFYRVKSIGTAGEIKYSSIVKVAAGAVKAGYSIAPNPVEGGVVSLQFSNQPAGVYNLRVLTIVGQAVMTQQAVHAGGSSTQVLNLPAGIARGTYQVEIIAPDKTRTTQSLFVNSK